MFFRKENFNFTLYILGKIPIKERNSIRAVTPQSILSILEFAISNTYSGQIQTDAEEEISIFKVILIENVKFTKLQLLGFKSTEYILPERIPFIYLSTMFADFDLVNINTNTSLICQTIKSFEIINFIKTNKKTQGIYNNLLDEYKCKDSDDFLNKLISITTYIYSKKKEGSTFILLSADDPNYESYKYFLDKFSINTNLEAKKELDFINLRNRPLIKINDSKYMAIHDSFTIDILHKGIYFILNNVFSKLPMSDQKKIGEFRSFYGKNYFEEYLVSNLFDELYKKKNKAFSGSEMKLNLKNEEPDYYVRNGNYIYLFEAKDILVKKEVKTSFDFSLIEEEFKEKLFFSSRNKKKKAVLQLLSSLKKILKNEFTFDYGLEPEKARIYPIIILQDTLYNVPGLNYMVNLWFFEELLKLDDENINIEKVKPLTIIDIDTFILYSSYFKKNNVKLHTLIDDYHSKHTKCKIKGTVIKGIIQEQINEPISFSLYVDNYYTKVPNSQILPITKLKTKLLTLIKKDNQ